MGRGIEYCRLSARILLGCVLFSLGFNLFLLPNELNAGGLSGLSMALVHLTGFGTVGVFTLIMNLPLFALAGVKIGPKFFWLSMVGTAASAVFIDLFALLPKPATEPLIGCLYGGLLCGLGLGTVFSAGGSTGGSDIIVRLLKRRYANIPLGTIAIGFDVMVAVITGIIFRNISRTLYSAIAIFLSGGVMDAVVYRFDYSRVALIVTKQHTLIAQRIAAVLGRGATFLHAQGSYSLRNTEVVLTVVRRQQLTALKRLVIETDPEAFIIVQEAHQVLGDGFLRYGAENL